MSDRQALPQGTILSGFRIDSELGRGGFGITYRAQDTQSAEVVALKEFFPQQMSFRESATMSVRTTAPKYEIEYEKGRQRVIAEASTLMLFRHKNIVQLRSYFLQNNTIYLVLSYERGRSLRDWLSHLGRPPTQAELDGLLPPLLDALQVVHRNKLLHRDLAPDNIFIRANTDPVLLDFGSARVTVNRHGNQPTGFIKPGYSPHEQYLLDASKQGPWTDIYSLGATLYEAITGRPPPDGRTRLVEDPLIPAAAAATGSYRPAFLAAVDHALVLPISGRPQSIREWRETLFSQSVPVAPAGTAALPRVPDHRAPSSNGPGLISRIANWLR